MLYVYPDLQAYRKGRFTGFVRQPEKTGPVLFSNSSPSYARLEPVRRDGRRGGDDGGGGGSGGLIAIIVGGASRCWAAGVFLLRCAGSTADERE